MLCNLVCFDLSLNSSDNFIYISLFFSFYLSLLFYFIFCKILSDAKTFKLFLKMSHGNRIFKNVCFDKSPNYHPKKNLLNLFYIQLVIDCYYKKLFNLYNIIFDN